MLTGMAEKVRGSPLSVKKPDVCPIPGCNDRNIFVIVSPPIGMCDAGHFFRPTSVNGEVRWVEAKDNGRESA